MYTSFFGLHEKPFSITPDPRYLFLSERHAEALAHLLYGVREAGGFIQLTGEVGTGKTTLVRSLLQQLPDTADVALILNPQLSRVEFLCAICEELGVPLPEARGSIKALIHALNRFLLENHSRGRRTILIVAEAQNLRPDVLEQVRLLTNLETTKQKLLQIILIGQPELREHKYSILGAFRGIARMIAYEVPMGVCVISVAVMAHSLNLVEIVESQTVWYAFAQPLGFAIFVIALITDLGRIPFDQSEAEEEIISGYNTEYSGIRWGLLYFQEYNNALLGSILLCLLFLGGWHGPIIPIPILDIISPLIWLFMKVGIVLWFLIWVRSSLFRLRIDQVTDLGWKWMLPLSLLNLGWAVIIGSYFA